MSTLINSANLFELYRILVSNGYRCQIVCMDSDITEITIPYDEKHDVLISCFVNKFYGNDTRIHLDYLSEGIPVMGHYHTMQLDVSVYSDKVIVECIDDNNGQHVIIASERTHTYELEHDN